MVVLENISKSYHYGKKNEIKALVDITLTIDKGELVAITGPSGAGKSTLLHLIGCIDKANSGLYSIDGICISKLKDRKLSQIRNEKVGIVLQDFALIDEYTAIENVMIPLYFSKKRRKDRKKLATEAMRAVGIESIKDQLASELSGGQKQRVAIARSIVNGPDIILADEPTGALDSATSLEIIDLLADLNNQGKTVIIVTHDPLVSNACKRQIHIHDGRLT
ncbi:MAG: ABC transporter ATP-binding protein [Bacillota bacterium]|nr:ABC transporter ATP-binding protein [Bacillota bacterium]